MSLFPFIDNEDNLAINNTLPLYKEVAWDFNTDCPILEYGNPKIVEGNEAIKVWAYKALLIPRYQNIIYSWDYGSELISLIGKAYTPSLIKSEAKRYIKEALEINPYILEATVLDINFNYGELSATIKLITIYGESEVIL